MASSATLLYQSQQEVGGHTFYQLRLNLVPEIYEDLINPLLFIIGEELPDELELLDLPFLIPSTIVSGTQLQNYSSVGSYTLPESIYFAYAKGNPHIHAIKDIDEPDDFDIGVAQAFLGETEIWYSDIDPDELESWPSGDDPDDIEPDTSGWAYPDNLDSWGYVMHGIAGRYLSPWYYTDVWLEGLIVWAGCTDWEEDEDHFLSNTPSQYLGNRYRYAEPNKIYSCNEEDSNFLYWVERETTGSVETVNLWRFESGDNAYYYPSRDYSEAQPGVNPYDVIIQPGLDLLNLLDINIPAMQGGIWQLTHLANLYARKRPYLLGDGSGFVVGNVNHIIGEE